MTPAAAEPQDEVRVRAWAEARHVLAIRLDSLGDVLMTGPALRALRASARGRRVTLLTSPAGAPAGALLPEVEEVLVYDAPWLKATAPRNDSAPDLAMLERLRAGRFDAVVIFTVYSQNPLPSAMACYLAGIPLRLAHCRENPYQLLSDWVREREPEQLTRHEVRRQLDLVAAVGCRTEDERMLVPVSASAAARAAELLGEHGIDRSRPWAVLHAGASAPSRRYPSEQFARVLRGLAALGWQAVFVGQDDERGLAESIVAQAGIPVPSLVGLLDLPALGAVLALAPVLVANNSGPVHLAASVGTPVVDLYALTNPQHTPWGVPSRVLFHDVPCRYCYRSVCPEGHQNCLGLVPPDMVVEAAAAIARAPGGPPPPALHSGTYEGATGRAAPDDAAAARRR